MYEESNKLTVGISGLSLPNLLTIIFVVLKLCKVITWKWVFVLLPTIISAGLTVILIIFTIITACIFGRGD